MRKKEAFLLHVMLADIKSFSEEYNLPPIMEHTVELKRKLIAEFGDEIRLFPSGKYLIVHASSINPCQYSVAILQGRCLRDDDFVKSFSSFIRLKAKCIAMSIQEENNESPQHLVDMLDRGPMQELYNVIYASIYTSEYQLNESGYTVTSSNNMATKIWSLASDWESLIRKRKFSQAVDFGTNSTSNYSQQRNYKEPPSFRTYSILQRYIKTEQAVVQDGIIDAFKFCERVLKRNTCALFN